jgi:hypothetical protein
MKIEAWNSSLTRLLDAIDTGLLDAIDESMFGSVVADIF